MQEFKLTARGDGDGAGHVFGSGVKMLGGKNPGGISSIEMVPEPGGGGGNLPGGSGRLPGENGGLPGGGRLGGPGICVPGRAKLESWIWTWGGSELRSESEVMVVTDVVGVPGGVGMDVGIAFGAKI